MPQLRLLRHSWGALVAAEDCRHRARQHSLNRKQFGKQLAEMLTDIALGLQGSLRVGRLMEAGKIAAEVISIVKRNNCGRRSTLRGWPATLTCH